MVNQKNEFIELNNVKLVISSKNKKLYPLQGVTFTIPYNKKVALVGESGSGKSLTAASIIGMLPSNAEIVEGKILMNGSNIVNLSEKEFQQIRGKEISIIFQNPKESLNPIISVGNQIAEVIRVHEKLSRKESINKAIKSLELLGISSPAKRFEDYPHQYSGGMAQRAALAMAMACRPSLLIADEPTSGLDATLQQQVLELLSNQVQEQKSSLLLITHDISVVGATCEQVAVMYGGRIMEFGDTKTILNNPVNPYTIKLIESFRRSKKKRMTTIPGSVKPLVDELKGCPFAPRCYMAEKDCYNLLPSLSFVKNRFVACSKL
jgi:oligopeptide/dipeptide ABC transporter ATP-binding protein|tara:strand:- start:1977 stop:2939 length:963 start_codon:yes stop_codon:yes gene_type:complete